MAARAFAKLSEIAELIQGGRHRLSGKHFVEHGFPAYGAGGLNGYLESYEFEGPGLVLGTVGTCGRCYFASDRWTSLANTRVILPNPDRVDIRFLWHQLNRPETWYLSGTAQPFIKPSDVASRLVYLPPMTEQRRIAAILDQADALRAKRRAALAQLDEMVRAIFVEMFGDPIRASGRWPLACLSDLGAIHTGKTPPTAQQGMFGGAIPFATPGDLDDGLVRTERTLTKAGAAHTRIVRAGSALVGCIGNIGKMAKSPTACAFNQQINAIEWGAQIDDAYGIAALPFAKPQMLSLASSTTVPILNKSAFSKVQILVPPIATQREFADRIRGLDAVKETYVRSRDLMEHMFIGLQHRAFRGEL
jgi:type I restriction enzyme, S subunit